MEDRSMLNSFSAKVLAHIRQTCGSTFPLHGQGIGNCRKSHDVAAIEDAELFDWCCLYPNQKGGNPLDYRENFDFCTDHGIFSCLCIPDTLPDYQKAISFGCRMFTSNDIYTADRILTELGVRNSQQ